MKPLPEPSEAATQAAIALGLPQCIGDVKDMLRVAYAFDMAARDADAARYRFLRARDLDSIEKGGVFAGMSQNIVLNEGDLDRAIDIAIAEASKLPLSQCETTDEPLGCEITVTMPEWLAIEKELV
jgi:hypothetical protein